MAEQQDYRFVSSMGDTRNAQSELVAWGLRTADRNVYVSIEMGRITDLGRLALAEWQRKGDGR